MKKYLKTMEQVIQALKDGKTVEDRDYKYKLISGMICSIDKQEEKRGSLKWAVGDCVDVWAKPYITEPEIFKLEVGKFYKTRRGEKVICLCHKCNEYYIHKLNSYVVGYWVDKTGRMLFNGKPERTETDSDVVGLWEE